MARKRKARPNGQGSVYHDGRRWCAAITVDGRPVVRTSIHENVAYERLRQLQNEYATGVVLSPRMTVGDLLVRFRAHKRLTVTPKGYEGIEQSTRLHLIPRLGTRKVATLRPSDVEAMMVAIAAQSGAYTAHRARNVLRAAWNWGIREGALPAMNPAKYAHPGVVRYDPEERGALGVEDARAVAQAPHHLRSLWVLMLYTGLRPGECAGLCWDDLDLDGGVVHVPGTKTVGSRADVLLAPVVVDVLKRHRADVTRTQGIPAMSDRVWLTRTGRVYLVNNLRRVWLAHLARLGVRRVTLYAARHTCATLLRAEGVRLEIIQSILRHAKISTTALYAHRSLDEQREATAAIQRVLGD